MTEQSEALRLFTHQLLNHEGNPDGVHLGCDDLEVCKQSHVDGETSPVIHEWVDAAELRRLAAVEAQRDALLRILKSELQHAEWQDKIIYPVGSEEFQNWKISIYLPVPLSASDKSPQAALDRLVDADIKAVEEGK